MTNARRALYLGLGVLVAMVAGHALLVGLGQRPVHETGEQGLIE